MMSTTRTSALVGVLTVVVLLSLHIATAARVTAAPLGADSTSVPLAVTDTITEDGSLVDNTGVASPPFEASDPDTIDQNKAAGPSVGWQLWDKGIRPILTGLIGGVLAIALLKRWERRRALPRAQFSL